MTHAEKSARTFIGARTRELRKKRRMTQAQLAKELGIAQGTLSLVESGTASLSAEQLLLLLKLFNVSASTFSRETPHDPADDLQNALARYGASHLGEVADRIVEEPRDVGALVRDALASGDARFIAALAPIVVRHIERINLSQVTLELRSTGIERRVPWLVDNIVRAIELRRRALPPPRVAALYRRAELLLRLVTQPAVDVARPPDVLDRSIRTSKGVAEVEATASDISRTWRVVTALSPEDFAGALEAAVER